MGLNNRLDMGRIILVVLSSVTIATMMSVDAVLMQVFLTGSSNLGIVFLVPTALSLIMIEAFTFILILGTMSTNLEMHGRSNTWRLAWLFLIAFLIMIMGMIDMLVFNSYASISIQVSAPSLVMDKSVGMGLAFYNGGLAIVIYSMVNLLRSSTPDPNSLDKSKRNNNNTPGIISLTDNNKNDNDIDII